MILTAPAASLAVIPQLPQTASGLGPEQDGAIINSHITVQSVLPGVPPAAACFCVSDTD